MKKIKILLLVFVCILVSIIVFAPDSWAENNSQTKQYNVVNKRVIYSKCELHKVPPRRYWDCNVIVDGQLVSVRSNSDIPLGIHRVIIDSDGKFYDFVHFTEKGH